MCRAKHPNLDLNRNPEASGMVDGLLGALAEGRISVLRPSPLVPVLIVPPRCAVLVVRLRRNVRAHRPLKARRRLARE